METNLNLIQLYRGYVLSYGSLNIPASKNDLNRPLATHQVITYWSNLGLALGFYPWCEHKQNDLEWYFKNDKLVLHLESENLSSKREGTVQKLARSSAPYKVGIVFVHEKDNLNLSDWKNYLEQNMVEQGEALFITTWWNEEKIKDGKYLVTGHHVKPDKVFELDKAHLTWPKYGGLQMSFLQEENW